MSYYPLPEGLAGHHQIAGFCCRSEEQTAWQVEVARQTDGAGTTRVLLVTDLLERLRP